MIEKERKEVQDQMSFLNENLDLIKSYFEDKIGKHRAIVKEQEENESQNALIYQTIDKVDAEIAKAKALAEGFGAQDEDFHYP